MPGTTVSPELYETLRNAQRLGFFGPSSLEGAIDQARDFVALIPSEDGGVVDIGSGGGLPGLVIAELRPERGLTLIERRVTRADFLSRAVRRHRWDSRVRVIAGDVLNAELADTPVVITARGFADAPTTAAATQHWMRDGAVLVVSNPIADQGERWRQCGLEVEAQLGTVLRLRLAHDGTICPGVAEG